MNKKIVINLNNEELSYVIFYPDNFENLPLITYLHGAGERGKNIEHIFSFGLAKLLNNGFEVPAVVLCPQCPARFCWNNIVKEVKDLIDKTVEKFSIKSDRITITGSSMGGYGTWEMGICYPMFFAGIAPVAGGGSLIHRTCNLKNTPVRAFHGDKDGCVPLWRSEEMVNSTNSHGGNAGLTVLEGHDHGDGIDFAYENTDLVDWLLKCRRTDFSYVPEYMEEWF